ncbi:MAG: hypothetical protein U0R71_14610 [Solirubrobacterales bacterium]
MSAGPGFDPVDGLRRFFAQMDSEEPYDVVSTLREDFRFTVFFAREDGTEEFAGGHADWDRYMAQRPQENRPFHELDLVAGTGLAAMALGRTLLGDELVATFTAVLEFDDAGRIRSYFAARTTDLHLAKESLPGAPPRPRSAVFSGPE